MLLIVAYNFHVEKILNIAYGFTLTSRRSLLFLFLSTIKITIMVRTGFTRAKTSKESSCRRVAKVVAYVTNTLSFNISASSANRKFWKT